MTPDQESEYARIVAWRSLSPAERDAAIDAQWRAKAADDISIRIALDAELCPFGSGPCGCGDGPPRLCGHPDRPAEVRAEECRACVGRAWWEAGSG